MISPSVMLSADGIHGFIWTGKAAKPMSAFNADAMDEERRQMVSADNKRRKLGYQPRQ